MRRTNRVLSAATTAAMIVVLAGPVMAHTGGIIGGLESGLMHPITGLDHVVAVLDGLFDEYREERYRAAPLLRRLVLSGRVGHATGEGFFTYDDPDEEID